MNLSVLHNDVALDETGPAVFLVNDPLKLP